MLALLEKLILLFEALLADIDYSIRFLNALNFHSFDKLEHPEIFASDAKLSCDFMLPLQVEIVMAGHSTALYTTTSVMALNNWLNKTVHLFLPFKLSQRSCPGKDRLRSIKFNLFLFGIPV